jgi:drug/metabolite transporter (DMT)-like permease
MTAPRQGAPAFNPYLALVSGVMAVSTGAIFARMADAPALVTAAYRVGIASLILVPVAWVSARHEIQRLCPGEIVRAGCAGLFLALHFATWISSLNYTSVTNSVVLVNTNPLWVGVLAPLIAKETLHRRAKLSILVSVAGGVVIGASDFATGGHALLGDGLALAGSLCAALYLLLGKTLRQKLGLTAYVSLCYGTAAIILWAIVAAARLPIIGFSPRTWEAFLAMAIVAQLIGHTSYNWALKWFSTSTIAVSLLGEPIGATILAYVLFGEGLTLQKLAGGALILTGIYLAASGEAPREKGI